MPKPAAPVDSSDSSGSGSELPPKDSDTFDEISKTAEKSINDMDVDVYLFTLSPHPGVYNCVNVRDQYVSLLYRIFMRSGNIRSFGEYAFTPEVNANGYVHIHGWFTIADKIKYHKSFLPACKKLGFIKVDVVKHKDKTCEALKYYKKDGHMMEELVAPIKIPLTRFNYKDVKRVLNGIVRNSKFKLKYVPSPASYFKKTKVTKYFKV